MSARQADAGMRAVARVRGVREQDARLGLTAALAERRQCEQRVADVRRRLTAGDGFSAGTGAELATRRATMTSLGEELRSAEEALATAHRLATVAQGHWSEAKTRLSAVEMLLERRAAERRVERARREAAELDDIAGQLVQRRARSGGER
ncbi:flagellar FliJ family protein [Nocardioides sp. AE5]|uniref:flagellar FliJ family protein n=1 Tax=Nocardioides sp. AE5 TaxID=2962573 RepID=UPI0028811169|nr:flagellar FliJ family protein [Nocardioides sp. AE5]MDT0200799.1 flagellar FliJ family protein [Nocardioides sp. AE5]